MRMFKDNSLRAGNSFHIKNHFSVTRDTVDQSLLLETPSSLRSNHDDTSSYFSGHPFSLLSPHVFSAHARTT